MPSMADVKNAVMEWMQRNVAPPTGNFFQTRITHTPGMVTNVPDASATYTGTDDPASIVRASNLNESIRNVLAQDWSGQKGFIRVNPDRVNSKFLRHEQIHDVFDKGGLAENQSQIAPLLAPSWRNYVTENPIYSGISPAQQTNEALAYQLSSSPEDNLSNQIASMLNAKGKPLQAKQIKELAK